jgi:hypothetical protein
MPGALYVVPLRATVTVTARQDLLGIYAGTSAFFVREAVLAQVTETSQENLPISMVRLPATVTSGSGGSSVTPTEYGANQGSISDVTARTQDTTQATTSGTATILPDAFPELPGWHQIYDPPILIAPGEAAILSLDGTASSTRAMSGWVLIEVLF